MKNSMLNSIVDELPDDLDKTLIRDLFQEYKEIKISFHIQNYELTLTKLGKFVETTFQLLSTVAFSETPTQPKLNELSKKLENIPGANQPVAVRVLIPRVCLMLYAIRSKRGAVHKNHETSTGYIDSQLALAGCNWIISELLRIYLKREPTEVQRIIDSISKIPHSLIEEIDGDVIILEPKMSLKEQVLILLHHEYPSPIPNNVIRSRIKGKSLTHLSEILKKLVRDAFVHKTDQGYTLTIKGISEAEKIYGKYRKIE